MQFQITRPEPNVGREDRLIRSVLAACLLSMSAFGLIATRSITLVSLLFAISGAYCAWSAATARCFAYARLAVDTRSESEAAAQARARELARAAREQSSEGARDAVQVSPASAESTPNEAELVPAAAQAGADHCKAGQSKAGQSKAGQSKTGQSKAGQFKTGQSKAGQPKAAQPEAGQSETGQPRAGANSRPADEWGHSLLGRN